MGIAHQVGHTLNQRSIDLLCLLYDHNEFI